MGLGDITKKLKKAKNLAGDVIGGGIGVLKDEGDAATEYLANFAGSAASAVRAVPGAIEDFNAAQERFLAGKPGLQRARTSAANLAALTSGFPLTPDTRKNTLLETIVQPFYDLQQIGNRALADPIIYGTHRALDPESAAADITVIDPKTGQPRTLAKGPFGDVQERASLALGERGGAAEVLGQAGIFGANLVTDPTSWLPGSVGLAGKIKNPALRLGAELASGPLTGFGGRGLAPGIRAAVTGAGFGAGATVVKDIYAARGEEPPGVMAVFGGIGAAMLLGAGASRAPILRGAFDHVPKVGSPEAVAEAIQGAVRAKDISVTTLAEVNRLLEDTPVASLHPRDKAKVADTLGRLWDRVDETQRPADFEPPIRPELRERTLLDRMKEDLLGPSVDLSGTRELGLGIKLPARYALPVLAGSVVGALANPDDMAAGAAEGAGAGLTAAVGGRLLYRFGAQPSARALQRFFSPGSLARPDMRRMVQLANGMADNVHIRLEPMAEEARGVSEMLKRGVAIDPDIEARLLSEAAAKDAAGANLGAPRVYGPLTKAEEALYARRGIGPLPEPGPVEQRTRELIGSFRDIMEHPDDYGRAAWSADTQAAFAKARDHYDAMLREEIASGSWDARRNAWNREAGEAMSKAKQARRKADAVYRTATEEARRVEVPLGQRASKLRDLAMDYRARGARFGQAAMGPFAREEGLIRMDDHHANVLLRATQAVEGAEEWYARQADAIAARAESLSVRADKAATDAPASGSFRAARRQAASRAAVDRFEASAAYVLTPKGAAMRPRAAAAVRRLRKALDGINSSDEADAVVRDFEDLSDRAFKIQEAAGDVAAAPTPAEALPRLDQLRREVVNAGEDAQKAVDKAQQRGQRTAVRAQDGFELAARLVDRQADLAEAAATRTVSGIYLRAGQKMAGLSSRAAQFDARATELWGRIGRPVENYVPHLYEKSGGGPAVGRRFVIGGTEGVQLERAYKDYRAAVLDGARPLTDDAGELVKTRGTFHARMLKSRVIVKAFIDEVKKPLPKSASDPFPVILPSFATDHIRDLLPGATREEKQAAFMAKYAPLDMTVILADEKDALRAMLDEVAARPNLPPGMTRTEAGQVRSQINRGDVSFSIERDTANFLDNAFAPGRWGTGAAGSFVNEVAGTGRSAVLGMDAAMLLRILPSAWVQGVTGARSARGAGAAFHAFLDAAAPDAFEKLKSGRVLDADGNPLYATWAKWMEGLRGRSEPSLDLPERGLAIERGLGWKGHLVSTGIGAAAGYAIGDEQGAAIGAGVGFATPSALRYLGAPLERWQFERLIPSLKVRTAEAIYRSVKDHYAAKGMTDDAIRYEVGKRIDTVVSGFSRIRAGVSRDTEFVNRLGLISPAYARGAFANVADITKDNIEGRLARGYWGGIAVAAVGAAVLTTAAFAADKDFNVQTMTELLDPRSEDSVTNPRSPNFLKSRLPNGVKVDIWGPVVPMARALFRPIGTGIGAYAEAKDEGLSIGEALGKSIEGIGGEYEAVTDWLQGRMAIPVSLLWSLIDNQDFRDRAITNEAATRDQWRDRFRFIAGGLLPGAADAGVDSSRGALPEWNLTEGNVTRAIGSTLGANVTPPRAYVSDAYTPELEQQIRGLLLDHGIAPGEDPLAAYRKTDKLDQIDRGTFEAKNPSLRTVLEDERVQRAKTVEQPTGGAAVTLYYDKKIQFDRDRKAQLDALYAELNAPGSVLAGAEFRQRRAEIMQKHANALETAGRIYIGASTYAERQKKIDDFYGGRDPNASPREKALDALYSIEPTNGSREALADYSERRKAFLDTGVLEDPATGERVTFGEGTMAELRTYLVEREPDPNERAYQAAVDRFSEYTSMPTYIGLTAKEGREIARIHDRAKELIAKRQARTMRQGIIMDAGSDLDAKVNALYALKRKARDQVKQQWMKDQTNWEALGRFFSDLTQEQFDEIASRPAA